MRFFIVGAPNIFDRSDAAIYSKGAAFPSSNLQLQGLGTIWRSAANSYGNVNTWMTNLYLGAERSGGSLSYSTAAVALRGFFLSDSSQYANLRWRVRMLASSTVGLTALVHPVPLSISNVSNLSGAFSDIADSPYAPDANWLTAPTKTSNTTVRVAFSSISDGTLLLTSGAGLQIVNILLRKSGASGTDPTVTIKLYEGTTLKATLVSGVAVTSSTAQFLQTSFDAASLSSLIATPSIQIEGTAGTAHTVEVGAIDLLMEHSNYTHDSGTLTPVLESAIDYGGAIKQLDYVPASPVVLGSATQSVLIDMKGVGSSTYVEAGRLIAGPALGPTGTDIDFGWSTQFIDPSIAQVSLGGNRWLTARRRFRQLRCQIGNMTEAEAYDQFFDKLDRAKGSASDFIAYPQPGNSAQFYNQAIYGHLAEIQPVEHQGYFGGAHKYRRSFTVEELF